MNRRTDELNANDVTRKVFVADLRVAEQTFIQYNKKAKPLFGTDPYAAKVVIDKIKISNVEVEQEK